MPYELFSILLSFQPRFSLSLKEHDYHWNFDKNPSNFNDEIECNG